MGDQSFLLNWHHDDYETAKQHILEQLGNYHEELDLWGRSVMVAVYIRPLVKPGTTIQFTDTQQKEDQFQGKVGMILAMGPDAFKGDASWINAQFGGEGGVPKVGDWLFSSANDGITLQIGGSGGKRVMGILPHRRAEEPLYFFDGWCCRIIRDDLFIGRVKNPHMVV
jgi:hypothetical protein